MSASYKAVHWNIQKRRYDLVLTIFVAVYLILFTVITWTINPTVTQETLIIRGSSTLALLLLHLILMIGPLSRLFPVFLPLLYNRRHLGVTMFTVSCVHGVASIYQFHSLGNLNPMLSVFLSNTHYSSLSRFPFEALGAIALLIFFLMAITSHDFWLNMLGARVWKTLHMMVYVAYALVVLHVLLGVVQYESSPVLVTCLGLGIITLSTLHVLAGSRERRVDEPTVIDLSTRLMRVGPVHDIKDSRAKIIRVGSERIAIFRNENKLTALSNVCKHQNGPLGEGRIIDGCITCPWHGYQYQPNNGSSPPPFKEKVATYNLHLIDNEVWIDPLPNPEGTETVPLKIPMYAR